jgi:exodeoxyribonuclease V alpha subunit
MDSDQLYRIGVLNRIDRSFAAMLHRMEGNGDPWVALAAGLVSRAAADGNVCLDLASIVDDGIQPPDGGRSIPVDISLEGWRQRLLDSPAVGTTHDKKPLILDGNLLYLQRYWNYENIVAQWIIERCQSHAPVAQGRGAIDAGRHGLAGGQQADSDQERAVQAALGNRFTVISGGPGTGKTTTIARIIVALHRLATDKPPRILLAAPTGKAAARMQEALHRGMSELLDDRESGMAADAIQAKTLHRLLQIQPGKHRIGYTQAFPLPADVIIVDEASMIDLALMARLIQAVPSDARLILVGDKDQLASVEAGSVMGDICAGIGSMGTKDAGRNAEAGAKAQSTSHMVVLAKCYRFGADSGIEALGRAINAGNSRRVMDLLASTDKERIDFKPLNGIGEMEKDLTRLVMATIAPVFEAVDPLEALGRFDGLKILTPVRKGPYGVEAINHLVEATLRRHGVIDPLPGWGGQWYPGRPVMMKRNDYHHHLFNGDVGITMVGYAADGLAQVRVAFPDGRGEMRSLVPEQLPDHETVYAMSVHKSQGTEFQRVVLILPDRDSPLLTRELIYTAVTRARQTVEIWGRQDILMAAVQRRIHRASGLRNKLRQNY